MAERYQSTVKKSTKKFEVPGRKELAVNLPGAPDFVDKDRR